MMASKALLRQRVLQLREAVPAALHRQWSDAITGCVLAHPGYLPAGTVMAYAAFRREVDTAGIILASRAAAKRVVLPRCAPGEKSLELYAVEEAGQLAPGAYGILEPVPARCRRVPAGEVELVCVPGVAFTREGGRLGYGGGYYDRFLTSLPAGAISLGLAFELQLVDAVPLAGHDHRVTFVVTEAGVYPAARG
ncbi:MAG TPA: 5-formyltetrahydrofolate cyclo-ligase [Clostridiales bacterium UBA8153]|nr:5-formyltetrahydrofolate cyclo-ligase [Clostridiales bacterium UBA8153]